eukprot:4777085-Lingulodinium_polyedra.AAC.1
MASGRVPPPYSKEGAPAVGGGSGVCSTRVPANRKFRPTAAVRVGYALYCPGHVVFGRARPGFTGQGLRSSLPKVQAPVPLDGRAS